VAVPIAGNLCVDAFRRNKKRGMVHSLDAPLSDDEEGTTRDVPDLSQAPETVIGRKELATQIQEALAKLPPKLRSAIILHDVEGLPTRRLPLPKAYRLAR